MAADETIELELILVHQTADAFKVKSHEDAEAVWLPRSQVRVITNDGFIFEVECPVWLATEKGLV